MTARAQTALLFAALALALFAAGSWRAEARKAKPQRGGVTTEHRIYHYATVTPELLCPKRPASAAGAWLRLAIAQQADGSGNAWIIKCAY
jgi:hypothetical protein